MKSNPLYIFIISLLVLCQCSCVFLDNEKEEKVIARVNNVYLYESDFLQNLPNELSKEDSIVFANQYIQNWGTKQILKQRADLNLENQQQEDFDKLAEEYKLDLYVNTYLEALIEQKLDTLVTSKELDELYQKVKDNFKLNEALLKFRYISVPKSNADINDFSERLKRFDSIDELVLDSLSIQFHSFMLNDTTWIKKSKLLQELPILNKAANSQLLKKSNFLHLEDSLRVYLVRVKDVLERNEQSPKQYIAPTVEQIILNKRKLKLLKQLKIDLRKDAEQNEEFEIYN